MSKPTLLESITGSQKPQHTEPLLLRTEIKYERSVIHSCVQHTGRELNAALGLTDETLLDQYIATDAGKKWVAGFREYAIFALSKTI
jgi:hypothetical protein